MSVVRVPEFQAIERIPNPFTSQLRLQDWERPGIALALGGGFARGFAHLGVFEVLREENIPIAGIVGTSIGALLGAACADGVAIQELLRLGRNVRVRDILRFRNCRQGPQSRDCIGRFVRDNFRIARLEELPIPTAVVATNLDTFEPYIFRSGCIETAIRASCAFPGMFCPVELDGRVLVDGCMVAPVPTEIAARMSADCVLGVSVDANSQHVSSRGEVFRVFDRARRGAAKETFPPWITHADIMLEPAISHLNLMDFSRVDESHAAGVEAMRRALPFVRAILERQSHKASADVFDNPRRALIS